MCKWHMTERAKRRRAAWRKTNKLIPVNRPARARPAPGSAVRCACRQVNPPLASAPAIRHRRRSLAPGRMAKNHHYFSDGSFSLGNWRIDHFLATEVFRQASGVMSEGGSVGQIHDRPREETPRRMAKNHHYFSDGNFLSGKRREERGRECISNT